MENSGDRLKLAMDMRGVRPIDVKLHTGIDRPQLSKLIHNKVVNPDNVMDKLSHYLKISYTWLMTGMGEPESYFEEQGHTQIQASIYGKPDVNAIITLPWTVEYKHDAWYFDNASICFKEKTLILVEKKFTHGPGLFFAFNDDEPVALLREESIEGAEYVNKKSNTEIKGRILFYSVWDGEITLVDREP